MPQGIGLMVDLSGGPCMVVCLHAVVISIRLASLYQPASHVQVLGYGVMSDLISWLLGDDARNSLLEHMHAHVSLTVPVGAP